MVGVNTDHVADEVISLQAVIDAYVEQLHFAEDHGAGTVLMASRHLARAASSAADYEHVYREVLARAGRPGRAALAGRRVRPAAGRLLRRAATSPTNIDTVVAHHGRERRPGPRASR